MASRQLQSSKISQLESRLAALEKSFQESRDHMSAVSITSLHPEPFIVIEPLDVIVRRVDQDEFIASFADANMNASGDTAEEAIAGLKEIVAAKFKLFSRLGDARLGPEPKRQFAILKTHIQSL